MIRTLLASTAGILAAGTAAAGGYVAAIPQVAPTVAASPSAGQWMIGAALLAGIIALLGRDSGGSNFSSTPIDHGGPCFLEGTLIQVALGDLRPVETIRPGEWIFTSSGTQKVLSVESWQPTRYEDRPVIVKGVRLSPNHGVLQHDATDAEVLVPAHEVSSQRGLIDGRRYFHILVQDHAWLMACPADGSGFIWAETLAVTADMPALAKRFPHLVKRHAAHPVAPMREAVLQ